MNSMKITFEVLDNKAAFVMELLESIPFIKAKPVRGKAKLQDEPDYLLNTEANKKALLESIVQIEQGHVVTHNLLPD